jgi:cellulose synthase/poly-beta-1,6-N-acetylglucosamine synthase-like glycosyltransferase
LNLLEIILVIVGFLAIYNFIVYPVLLKILKIIRPKIILPDSDFEPEVTFIIAAYNEEALIEGAIDSINQSHYPKEKINIIIGSDGSTDGTNSILKNLASNNSSIKYYILNRSGKNNVLNNIVPLAKTEIILFMDADVRLNKDTLANLVSYFQNEKVGAVIASQTVVGDGETDNAGSEGDSFYHKYEENIRINEGITGSNVNSLGYLYGIRKNLYIPVPNNYVCDDLHNIYSVLQNKKRVLFAREAKAYEVRPKSLNNEFHRRVRAVAGGWATVVFHRNLLNIFTYGLTSFFIWSHKIFRWLSPVFLILLFVLTFAVYNSELIFSVFIIPQTIVYLSAILGWFFEKLNIKIKIFRLSLFFVSMNFSSLLGLFRFISRKQNAVWNREGFNN